MVFKRFFGGEAGASPETEHHEELETRIVYSKDNEEKAARVIREIGARLVQPERIVATTRFNIKAKFKLDKPYLDLPQDIVNANQEKTFELALKLLGLNVEARPGMSSYYQISSAGEPKNLKGYLARIRQQKLGSQPENIPQITFAVKGPKQDKHQNIKTRIEEEVTINNAAPLVQFFQAAGITEGDYRETKRTTYVADGIRIERDIYPDDRVKPSLEFEGEDPDKILALASKFRELGSPESVGESNFLKKMGLKREEMSDMRFDRTKRHYSRVGRKF